MIISLCLYITTGHNHQDTVETYVMDFIWLKNYNITPQEFDDYISRCPGYQIEHLSIGGNTALHIAALRGNYNLVKYVIYKYGNSFINQVNPYNGRTPLYNACTCEDIINGFKTADVLIRAGSDINLAVKLLNKFNDESINVHFATPLWACLQKPNNIPLAALLIKQGAIIHFPKESHIEIIKQILNMLMLSCVSNIKEVD